MSMEAKSADEISAEQWQQIKSIFQVAVDLDPSGQTAFLDRACAGDEVLRARVVSLLSSDGQGWDLLERPAFEAAADLLAAAQLELSVGEQVGNYQILGLLGKGGMGEVYLAEDRRLGRKIALKVLPTEYLQYEDRVQRFQQEARAASALNHPNIVTIHEISQSEGRHFIATEFVTGETLRSRMERQKPNPGECLDITIQVAGALAAAHEAGIVHRDIKPENIMLRQDGYVKVLDFGLAKLIDRKPFTTDTEEPVPDKLSTAPGMLMGTVSYMSPEQARGLDLDARSDIFSLGVVLYEIITGHAPFTGETPSDVLAAILMVEPPPLTHHSHNVPDQLQQIISHALHKSRDQRYQTVNEMLTDLKELKQVLDLEGRMHNYTRPASSGGVAAAITRPQTAIQTDKEPVARTQDQELARAAPTAKMTFSRRGVAFILPLLFIAAVAGGYGLYRLASEPGSVPFQKFHITKLTASGKAGDAAISPDGKYVANVARDAGQESIWVRQLSTGSTAQIVPPGTVRLAALTFSPDSNHIFYVRYDDKNSFANALHQVSVLGGPSNKIIAEVHSPISFSPDAKQFTFFRRFSGDRENALMIASIDGTGEQELARKKQLERFTDYPCGPAWSPDGRVIRCGVRTRKDDGTYNVDLLEVQVADGTQKVIASNHWRYFGGLSWLSDGNSLMIIAQAGPRPPATHQVWQVSYPGGEVRQITNDLNDYKGISIAADSMAFVASVWHWATNIWIVPHRDTSQAKAVTSGDNRIQGLSWSPDDRIIFAQVSHNKPDIWLTNADGGNQRQLTYEGKNHSPSVTPDGRHIIFTSDNNMCKMDIDGGNLKVIASEGFK